MTDANNYVNENGTPKTNNSVAYVKLENDKAYVTLVNNCTATTKMNVQKDITLISNGYTLTLSNGAYFEQTKNTFKIDNKRNGSKIVVTNDVTSANGYGVCSRGGKFELTGGTFVIADCTDSAESRPYAVFGIFANDGAKIENTTFESYNNSNLRYYFVSAKNNCVIKNININITGTQKNAMVRALQAEANGKNTIFQNIKIKADAEETYVICGTYASNASISKWENVTTDLQIKNGANSGTYNIMLATSAQATIKKCNYTINAKDESTGRKVGAYVNENAILNVENCTFNTTSGIKGPNQGIAIAKTGTANINGATIINNSNSYINLTQGIMVSEDATVNIYKCDITVDAISKHSAETGEYYNYGVGISSAGANLNITPENKQDVKIKASRTAIHMSTKLGKKSNVLITDGIFEGCVRSIDMRVRLNDSINITGGTFRGIEYFGDKGDEKDFSHKSNMTIFGCGDGTNTINISNITSEGKGLKGMEIYLYYYIPEDVDTETDELEIHTLSLIVNVENSKISGEEYDIVINKGNTINLKKGTTVEHNTIHKYNNGIVNDYR